MIPEEVADILYILSKHGLVYSEALQIAWNIYNSVIELRLNDAR